MLAEHRPPNLAPIRERSLVRRLFITGEDDLLAQEKRIHQVQDHLHVCLIAGLFVLRREYGAFAMLHITRETERRAKKTAKSYKGLYPEDTRRDRILAPVARFNLTVSRLFWGRKDSSTTVRS